MAPVDRRPSAVPEPAPGDVTAGGVFDIEMLPARNGDALWIEYGAPEAPNRVLIDCGRTETADVLLTRMASGRRPHFDLFVMTHIDADHIEGVEPLLGSTDFDATFDDVWFNGWKQINRYLSVRQGEGFSKLILQRDLPWNRAFGDQRYDQPRPVVVPRTGALPEIELAGGMKLTLLSPTIADLERLAVKWRQARIELERKGLLRAAHPDPVDDPAKLDLEALANRKLQRDPSAPNGSSIAFLAEYGGRSAIFTGDAHVGVLVDSIRRLLRARGAPEGGRLRVDALKLSHHGSRQAHSKALLDLLDCPRYLVSTNGFSHCHPDREAIARTILWGGDDATLYFNYRTEFNEYWGDEHFQQRHRYLTVYPPDGGQGVKISLTDGATEHDA
jgi:hypothetical protein